MICVIKKTGKITRKMLRENPNYIFLFGDNLEKMGFGGQAKEMRGEPNAIGIPTKISPSNFQHSFMTDNEYSYYSKRIRLAFDLIPENSTIVIPWDSEKNVSTIGIGLADMPNKCPNLYKYLCEKIRDLINISKVINDFSEK